MKNPKIIYILIGAFCFLAIIAGVYAQFFVSDQDKENILIPNLNQVGQEEIEEKTQEEIKEQFAGLLNNQLLANNYNTSNITKLNDNKQLVYTAIHKEEQNENYEIKVDLPVINIQNDVVASFNNITQTLFANKTAQILNNQINSKTIYNVSYASFMNDNILSVVIWSTLKEGNNPQRVMVQTYNYNLQTGEKVDVTQMISNKNIIQSDAQKKINQTIKKAMDEAETLLQSGYTIYDRDLDNKMYQLANITTYFLGPNGDLYIIFAYGNNNYTSEMDIILYE